MQRRGPLVGELADCGLEVTVQRGEHKGISADAGKGQDVGRHEGGVERREGVCGAILPKLGAR
ncbi:hypothetical protein SDC9_120660 [bioreactor metagenome]|uniref:Uncharacterized protein n=1 Tax=bioreactor metagenome TaxID=1076179 RepID=A0A645C839_9ZZZZ